MRNKTSHPKYRMKVLDWGTPSQSFHLMITTDKGDQKCFKSAARMDDLMKYFDLAVADAKEAAEQDGINRTVSIEQTLLQKNVWLL